MRTSFALACLVLLVAAVARAEKWPADAYRLNVTAAEFGAIPNDGLDDGPAVAAAIARYDLADTTIYFPCGQYDFTGPVEFKDSIPIGTPPTLPWTARTPWEGERQDCVTIKLADNAVGYGDPNAPKYFIATGSLRNSGRATTGSTGNEAYQNNFKDLTIDCGSGNPGVRCLDWLANNEGTIRNVTVRSGDGQGDTGVYMGRAWPGPCILENVRIEGFKYGVYLGQIQYSATFLDVTLVGQSVTGFYMGQNMASIERMTSDQTAHGVPAIINDQSYGQMAVLHSTFTGGDVSRGAIEVNVNSKYYLRDVTATGYGGAIKDGAIFTPSPITEMVSQKPYKLFNAPDAALNLPVEYPPESYYSDPDVHPEEWANVLAYGAGNGIGGEGNNDVAGIQAAMNSGKPIVYFPKRVPGDGSTPGINGTYAFIGPTINVPGTVRRVLLGGNNMVLRKVGYPSANDCIFTVVGTAADPPVEFSYFKRSGDDIAPARHFCNKSNGRTMVLRTFGSSTFTTSSGPGKTFLIDVITGLTVNGGHKVWGWSHNAEATSTVVPPSTFVDGEGTDVRIIGFKSERDFTQARVTNGGRYEMMEGFTFPCIGTPAVVSPGFEVIDAQMSVAFLQYCSKSPALPAYVFPVAIRHQLGTTVREFTSAQLLNIQTATINRNNAPLFNGYPNNNIRITPTLMDGPQSVTVPMGPLYLAFRLVQIDSSGVNGIAMDPGQWSEPANCQGMRSATFTVDKSGEGELDVDFWTCQDIEGGPPVGQFDPASPWSFAQPKNCRNASKDVIVDGVGTAPGTTKDFEYTNSMGKWMARVNVCNGDCSALITMQCSR